jgi:hypothetical protein
MLAVICRRVGGSFLSWESTLFLVSYVDICYVGCYSRASDASSICSHISFCGVMDGCGEIIVYVVYVVSCVGISFLPDIGCWSCFCSLVLLVLRQSHWSILSYGYDRQHNNEAEISSGEDKNMCWHISYLFNINIGLLRYMFRPII